MIPKNWSPRDWRMLYALGLLAVAGAGAWLITKWSLDALIDLSAQVQQIWPLAYFAYGALGLLGIPSLGFAMVVALKSFRLDLPGGSGIGAEGDSGAPAAAQAVADSAQDAADSIKEQINDQTDNRAG